MRSGNTPGKEETMSEPVPFKEQNTTFTRGENAESVCELPAYVGKIRIDETPNLYPCIISCWMLTEPEIQEIVRTGRVWLGVMGTSQPPVFAAAISPFGPGVNDGEQSVTVQE